MVRLPKKKRQRQDQLVEQYITTDLPLTTILTESPRPLSPVAQSLLSVQECLHGRRLAREALQAVQAVPMKGSDPELLVLMLASWAELSCRISRPADAEALIHRARTLVSEDTHSEVTAAVTLAESILADTTGDKTRREKLLRSILQEVPAHSPRRKYYAWELALLMALQGRGVESKEQIKELTWQCNDRFPLLRVLLVQFIDAIETGRVKDALFLRPKLTPVTQAANLLAMARISYRGYEELLRLMDPDREKNRPPPPGLPSWTHVADNLLSGQTETALRLARLETKDTLRSIFGSGFDSFSLIRAELSAGHRDGALRLLKMREARGNSHYLDSFFLARASLLEGNRKMAALHFGATLKAAEFYKAEGRLDFELLLAHELKQADVIDLSRRAGRSTPAHPPAHPPARPSPPAGPGPKETASGPGMLLGQSSSIAAVREAIRRFADLDAPVLITGETGTGKDLAARALHDISTRREAPFTPVNCGSITESLLESELFGHERGAFTGAEKANRGLFEETGGGTILLDEIGDISPRLQATLLRVLETGEIRAVGSARTRKINCRIVAATNADLDRLAEEGRFRRDLLFRLQRLGIYIQPLRERKDDILVLARRFLDTGRDIGLHATISPELADALREYDWPGNVRELRNVIERMRLMHSDKLSYTLEELDLKFRPNGMRSDASPRPPREPEPDESREKEMQEPPSAARRADPASSQREPASPTTDEEVRRILESGNSTLRRQERLRTLFLQYEKLTRSEVIKILGVSPNTATKYLKTLCEEGFAERVTPTASSRTHYFVLKKAKSGP
jgi:DNA-binding NtrC family response regulator